MRHSSILGQMASTLALCAFAFVACKKSQADEKGSAQEAATDGPRIAFLLATLQEERYKKDQAYFENTAKGLGLRPFTLSADNDNARQLSQVEDALARGAKLLVIQPTDSSAAASYVRKAHDRGAKVIAYDRSIVGADFWVAHDSFKVGVIQAEEALEAVEGRPTPHKFVLLNGQSGHSVAEEIARGYRETLAPAIQAGKVEIVLDKSHDAWSPEQALKTVEDALTKTQNDVDVILANNSGMARGAVQAIQAAGLGDKGVFIAGADADAANVNYVCEGKQSIDVLKEIKGLAETAASVSAKLLQGESAPADKQWQGVPVSAVPVHLVRSNNVFPVLVESGFHDARALTSCKR